MTITEHDSRGLFIFFFLAILFLFLLFLLFCVQERRKQHILLQEHDIYEGTNTRWNFRSLHLNVYHIFTLPICFLVCNERDKDRAAASRTQSHRLYYLNNILCMIKDEMQQVEKNGLQPSGLFMSFSRERFDLPISLTLPTLYRSPSDFLTQPLQVVVIWRK